METNKNLEGYKRRDVLFNDHKFTLWYLLPHVNVRNSFLTRLLWRKIILFFLFFFTFSLFLSGFRHLHMCPLGEYSFELKIKNQERKIKVKQKDFLYQQLKYTNSWWLDRIFLEKVQLWVPWKPNQLDWFLI